MNRRGFLQGLVGAAAIAATPALAEALLPKRTVFLPPKGGWPQYGVPKLYPYYHRSYTLDFKVVDEYAPIGEHYALLLAESMQQTKEKLIANILNGSFS